MNRYTSKSYTTTILLTYIGELQCQQLLDGINITLAGNAKSVKSFQNSSHIIYSRLIRDSAKAVKTGKRPWKLYLHQEHARNECRFIDSGSRLTLYNLANVLKDHWSVAEDLYATRL